METVRVQYSFAEDGFSDAVYFTEAEWNVIKNDKKAKDALKKARKDKHDLIVAEQSAVEPPPQPTPEELEAAYNALSDEEKYLVDQKALYIAMYGDLTNE